VSSSAGLSALPPAARRRGALGLGGFAVLAAVVGVLCLLAGEVVLLVIGVLALLVAVGAALAAGGMWYSVRLEQSAADVDRAVTDALAEHPRALQCDCGHEHDPDELHVTDAEPCAADGGGAACAHDCATCLFQRDASGSAAGSSKP
jgi:hypothetical protein